MVGANREVRARAQRSREEDSCLFQGEGGGCKAYGLTVSRVLCELESSVQMLIITHLGPGRSENQKGNIEKEVCVWCMWCVCVCVKKKERN